MSEETVTPVEKTPQPVEETKPIEKEEPPVEKTDESSDVEAQPDYQQKYEALEREVSQLKDFIRAQRDDVDEDNVTPKLPTDVKEFLTEFAEKPQETLDKVIKTAVKPYESILKELQQQQAIDYIRTQSDYNEKMYDDLLMIVEGSDKNRWFNFGNQSVKLKDLPPRQKAEAALQIYRERKSKPTQPQSRPQPVTTVKAKPTQKSSSKPDELLTADEFARKYGLKQGAV